MKTNNIKNIDGYDVIYNNGELAIGYNTTDKFILVLDHEIWTEQFTYNDINRLYQEVLNQLKVKYEIEVVGSLLEYANNNYTDSTDFDIDSINAQLSWLIKDMQGYLNPGYRLYDYYIFIEDETFTIGTVPNMNKSEFNYFKDLLFKPGHELVIYDQAYKDITEVRTNNHKNMVYTSLSEDWRWMDLIQEDHCDVTKF